MKIRQSRHDGHYSCRLKLFVGELSDEKGHLFSRDRKEGSQRTCYHVKYDVVTDILKKLDSVYGQEIVDGKRAEITINRGKIHDYLGMKLDYTKKGICKYHYAGFFKHSALLCT